MFLKGEGGIEQLGVERNIVSKGRSCIQAGTKDAQGLAQLPCSDDEAGVQKRGATAASPSAGESGGRVHIRLTSGTVPSIVTSCDVSVAVSRTQLHSARTCTRTSGRANAQSNRDLREGKCGRQKPRRKVRQDMEFLRHAQDRLIMSPAPPHHIWLYVRLYVSG